MKWPRFFIPWVSVEPYIFQTFLNAYTTVTLHLYSRTKVKANSSLSNRHKLTSTKVWLARGKSPIFNKQMLKHRRRTRLNRPAPEKKTQKCDEASEAGQKEGRVTERGKGTVQEERRAHLKGKVWHRLLDAQACSQLTQLLPSEYESGGQMDSDAAGTMMGCLSEHRGSTYGHWTNNWEPFPWSVHVPASSSCTGYQKRTVWLIL